MAKRDLDGTLIESSDDSIPPLPQESLLQGQDFVEPPKAPGRSPLPSEHAEKEA